MKMPRSHCENENVQFVQELAEVDGPFESPININFRDLTKLELPSLVWNRSDACPKKMKITNTGHTVIVSGKWKCERPYLTGGPLLGKYVFSQIHFHWGQDDCKGSEHLVSGEGFPLEMHVAHFKADYLSQECALKEKDGMVVLVYLFKLQNEPNTSLKKILNCLPNIKQANTSQQLDPRPILSLCNPFTDDYFMYWGSVVTSTCAHILMWLVCREPFGISKDQVNEFRKILDSAEQPICRNNREIQPLHKRNVFHVNASKNIDCPMLSIKKIVGCFCGKGSEDNDSIKSTKDCCCKSSAKDQEDVQVNLDEYNVGSQNLLNEEPACRRTERQVQDYVFHQSLFVQRAMIQSAPLLPKLFENTYLGQFWPSSSGREAGTSETPNAKFVSQSCCFVTGKEEDKSKKIRQEKRRTHSRSFNSIRALSQIMSSLEALKNQTCKKLREIDSINQEIKGMQFFCQEPEDRKWLKKIEKIMTRQRRFTVKSSQGYLAELKKLSKEYNMDQLFENKFASFGGSNKVMLVNKMTTEEVFPKLESVPVGESNQKIKSKSFSLDKVRKFSSKAQKLISSFFEDIRESDELHLNVKNNLILRKKKSILPSKAHRTKDSGSIRGEKKEGFITKKMFHTENLENRFFIEVKSEDLMRREEMDWRNPDVQANKFFVSVTESRPESRNIDITDSELLTRETPDDTILSTLKLQRESTIPLHRAEVGLDLMETQRNRVDDDPMEGKEIFKFDKGNQEGLNPLTDSETSTSCASFSADNKSNEEVYMVKNAKDYSFEEKSTVLDDELASETKPEKEMIPLKNSSSKSSSDSTGTQRMIIAKFRKRQTGKETSEDNSPPKSPCSKSSGKKSKIKNINFEGFFIKKKNRKGKKRKISRDHKSENGTESSCELSSLSKEDIQGSKTKGKWRNMTKARFKLKIEKKTSDGTSDSTVECSLESSPRKIQNHESARRKLIDESESCKNSAAPKSSENLQVQTDDEEIKDSSSARQMARTNGQETAYLMPENKFDDERKKQNSRENISLLDKISVSLMTKKDVSINSEISKGSNLEKNQIRFIEYTCGRRFFESEIPQADRRAIKPRSFVNLSNRSKNYSPELGKRIFVYANEERGKFEKEILDLKRNLDVFKGIDVIQYGKDSNKKIPSDEEPGKEKVTEDRIPGGYEVEFLTDSGPKETMCDLAYVQEGAFNASKNIGVRCDIERYHFLDRELQEIKSKRQNDTMAQSEAKINLSKTNSNKSIVSIGPDMKGDAISPKSEAKELSTTVSYTTVKKSPKSRPHSVESLTSLAKNSKLKRKKRPHCSKRISKHYMRKNSCVFRKPNKFDQKSINFLNLTTEEQLKIISVNVAKYLKQKLSEEKRELKSREKKDDIHEEHEFVEKQSKKEKLQNSDSDRILPKCEKETSQNAAEENERAKEKTEFDENRKNPAEISDKVVKAKFEPEKINENESLKIEEIEEPKSKKDESRVKKPGSPRPPLNFIKLNKLMAGKYKRMNAGDLKTDSQESQKKMEETSKGVAPKRKSSLFKSAEQKKPGSGGSGIADASKPEGEKKIFNKRPPRGNQTRIPEMIRNYKTTEKKNFKKSPKCEKKATSPRTKPEEPQKKVEKPVEQVESVTKLKSCTSLEATPSSLVPAYLMSSYLSSPVEGPEKHPKMNRFLMSVANANMNSYIPDVLCPEKGNFYETKSNASDAIFAKDLENLIKLQMCLNNEIASNIENSMNYIKTLLSQDYNGTAIVEKAPVSDSLDCFDSSQKGIVLIEMNDLMISSSSGSDCGEDIDGYPYLNEESSKMREKCDFKLLESLTGNRSGGLVPKEYGDSKVLNPVFLQGLELEEDYPSDSSYNCEISITLNGNANESAEVSNHGSVSCFNEYPVPSSTRLMRRESNASQLTAPLEGGHSSQSIVLKPMRKKRKDNEISVEMKKKLLEILEGEIRREMALNYRGSPGNSSDALTLKWDDSNGTNQSQSLTESSSDNTEVLAQISETMRQYLSEYKKRRLVKKKLDALDKSKSEYDS